jgi:hypothetical protein
MANKTEYARAAAPILKELLRTWCVAVKHGTSGEPIEKIGEKLFPGRDATKRFTRWEKGTNIPAMKELKEAARRAISNGWIPQNLSDSILNAFKNYDKEPRDGVDSFNLVKMVDLFDHFTSEKENPQHLVDQGEALRYLVHGLGDENSQEFKNWLALYKPFFLACEKQNLDEFIEHELTLDVANFYEKISGDSKNSLEFIGISAGMKGLRAVLPTDLGVIAQQIKAGTAALMSGLSAKTGLTHSQIAVLAGQPKSLGEFLAAGEVIPRLSAYRALECMAMLAEAGSIDSWIECYNAEQSSRLGHI